MVFFHALSFLTVIRFDNGKIFDDKDVAGWGRYFFLVGLLIGGLAAGVDYVLLKKFTPLVSSTVCVLFLTVITGGLHLDGLSDTFDGAFSMKSLEKKLEIMRQSTVGAFGVVSIVFTLLLKVALLAGIEAGDRFNVILLFPAISRMCILVPAYIYDYPREKGKGAGFIRHMTSSILIFGLTVSVVIVFLIMREQGLLLLILALVFSMLCAHFFSKRFNGVTGDVLGCINELTEIFVLFVFVLLS